MWPRRNKEWEQRQHYLLQSRIDTPRPSTIPETDEVNLDYSETREPSPLPDLIIEKEKNRHDEPEEFYQALEIKMKKLYKKLFLGTDDDSEKSEKSFETIETERSASLAHAIMVTQAIVHREVANDDFQDSNNNEITNERVSRSRPTESITYEPAHEKIDYSSKYKDTQQRHRDPDRLVVRQAKADKEIKTDEIDVMRQASNKTKSLGSIAEETAQSKEADSFTLLGALEVEAMSFIPNTSPETLFDSNPSKENIHKLVAKRPSSCANEYEGTPKEEKKPNTASVSVQTDMIQRNLNWEDLRGNLFVGPLKVYKLCSCRNHVCNQRNA